MTTESNPIPSGAGGDRPITRLTEALAAAQAVARQGFDDLSDDVGDIDLGDAGDPTMPGASRPTVDDGDTSIEWPDAERRADAPEDLAVRDAQVHQDRGPSTLLLVVMLLLVLAVPTIGYLGYRSITDNTRGQVLSGRSGPTDPGYEALVEPTPVALVIQKDASGTPLSLTVLSLSGPDQKGGAVVGIPLSTRLVKGVYNFRTFGDVLEHGSAEAEAKAIALQLGIGFTEVVELDDSTLARFTDPLGAVRVENPVVVTTASGTTFGAGTLELEPDQVGPYMSATDADGSSTAHLDRIQAVWTAWIAQVRNAKGTARIVPGELDAGLGRFIRGLAAGTVSGATLPVRPGEPIDDTPTVVMDRPLSNLMLTNAVPFPIAGVVGDRATTKVLNGVEPGPVPASVLQRLTFAGTQINVMGNNSTFGVKRTTVTYSNRADKRFVMRIVAMLGDVDIVHAQSGEDTTALTIVVGKDLIEHPPAPLSPSEVGK